ncbi:hypothetical protein GCM10028808_29660 [Spirosoma migulaei]
MNVRYYLVFSWSLLATLLACKHDQEQIIPGPEEPVKQNFIRPKGTPNGQLVQKTIGPEGGTLVSADHRLIMTIPAGAVKQVTNFSIQPITNTLSDSASSAYRLLPEGTTFEKPVTLQMPYTQTDLLNTSAQALFLAYQGSDGVWKYLPSTELDEANKTLKVQTHHFSDWGVFAEFYLSSNTGYLKAGESADVHLLTFDFGNITSLDNPEVAIAKQKTLNNPANIQNWKASVGTLEVHSSKTLASYTAPAEVPDYGLTALITVEVANFIPPGQVKRIGGTGRVTMLTTIIIEGQTYFHLFEDDDSRLDVTYGAFISAEEGGVITASMRNDQALAIVIYADPNDYRRSYPYYFSERDATKNHKAEISMGAPGSPENWISRYEGCTSTGEFDPHVSPGSVQITGQVVLNGKMYLTGSFIATLYLENGVCGKNYTRQERSVHGDFRVQVLN